MLVEKPFTETLAEAAGSGRARPRRVAACSWSTRTTAGSRPRALARSCSRDARDRPADRLLPRLPLRLRPRLSLLLPGRAAARATWRSTISTRSATSSTTSRSQVGCQSWSEPERPFKGRPAAIAAIRFAKGTLVSYRGSWISRGPDHALWRPLAARRHRRHDRVHVSAAPSSSARSSTACVLYRSRPPAGEAAKLPKMPLKDRAGALAAFARWIGAGKPPTALSTAEDNLRASP